MKGNTKVNHSFPQCLIKQWIDNAGHKYPNTVWICDKEYNIKEKGVGNIFYENNQYTQITEEVTSKDDDLLSKYVREIDAAESIGRKTEIFQDVRFLKLVYKLLCRTKNINKLFVDGTYKSLTFAKDLYTPGRVVANGLTTDKILKQTVNFHLLVEGNDDWAKIDYHFMVNRTDRRFVLADNIKDKLILSLSPNLCIGYSSNRQKAGNIAVVAHEVEDKNFVVNLNKKMLDGCDNFVVFYQKKDLGIAYIKSRYLR